MRVVTFDIETANWMSDIGSSDPADLTIALVCIHDSETDTYSSYLEPELPQMWNILERTDVLVGYNSNHFDIPLLNKYYPGDLTRIKSLDIMQEIYSVVGRRLKLDAIAEGTLGDRKSTRILPERRRDNQKALRLRARKGLAQISGTRESPRIQARYLKVARRERRCDDLHARALGLTNETIIRSLLHRREAVSPHDQQTFRGGPSC